MIIVLNFNYHNISKSINTCVEENKKILSYFNEEEAIILLVEKVKSKKID